MAVGVAALLLVAPPDVTTAIETAITHEHRADRHHPTLLGDVRGEVAAAHADHERDEQRPCHEQAARDVEGDLALLGAEDRREL